MQRLAQDAPFYEAKTFHFPDGGVETVAWRRIERGPSAADMPLRVVSAEEREARRLDSREFCARRAKSKVRRIARTLGLDRMLTFTTRELSTAYDDIVEDWARFRRAIKAGHPGFAYVAVVEPHPQNPGHYHLHVAVRGFHDVNVLRRTWHQVLRRRISADGSPGNVQVEKKRGGTAERIAKYLAKYLGKTFTEGALAHRKSYWSAAKASVLKVARWFPAAETWLELERELVGDECIREVQSFNPAPGVLWLSGWVAS